MDSVWYEVAVNMGHTPEILAYPSLLDTSFFKSTDLLIVSNAIVALFPSDIKTILWFLKKGKPVYLQSEYLRSFASNQAYARIIDSLGGAFSWDSEYSGDLIGMTVLGSFATTPNIIPPLEYYWYSVSGIGDCNMVYFLKYGAGYHGFQFIPPNPAFGNIITTADQDWIQERTSTELMENIITHLFHPSLISVGNSIDLTKDTSICTGQNVLLEVIAHNASYSWNDNSTTALIEVSNPGTYTVTVTLECGMVIDSVTVGIADCPCPLYTPNVFSPNQDNANDLFTINFQCDVSEYHLMIFDRWGSLVFSSNNNAKAWDGTIKGLMAPVGVYSYLLQYSFYGGEPKHTYGNITLIR